MASLVSGWNWPLMRSTFAHAWACSGCSSHAAHARRSLALTEPDCSRANHSAACCNTR